MDPATGRLTGTSAVIFRHPWQKLLLVPSLNPGNGEAIRPKAGRKREAMEFIQQLYDHGRT
jgi:hypothetical protein